MKMKCLYCRSTIAKGKVFCNAKCQGLHKRNLYIKRWKKGLETGTIGNKFVAQISRCIRRYLLEKANYKCCKCGWGKINKFTNTYPLRIDHKDGNAFNNAPKNLQVICPNCDSLQKTYAAANWGRGRKSRLTPTGRIKKSSKAKW